MTRSGIWASGPTESMDNLAFVIETEAKLDAIKAARAEVRGIGTDSQIAGKQMAAASTAQAEANVTTVAGTRNMGAWAAMQAEASSHVGEHSLAIGRLEMSLARFSERALGVNSTLGLLMTSLGKFAIGTIETAGVLAGIAAVVAIYDALTESARKATEEQNKAIEAFEKMAREKALGPEGAVIEGLNAQIASAQEGLASPFSRGSVASQQANLDRLNKDLRQATSERDAILGKSAENTDKAFAGNLASLVAYNANDEVARRHSLALIKAYQGELAQLGDADVEKRAEIIGKIKTLNATFEEEDKKAAALQKAALAKLTRIAGGVNAGDAVEKEQDRVETAEAKGAAMHAAMQAKILEATLRTTDQEMKARLAANDAEYMRRQQDIANLDATETRKTQLLRDNANLRVANEAQIRDAAQDKIDKERATAEAKLVAAEKRKERIMLHSIDAYVKSSASLQKILIEADRKSVV
jgi:hypothetical protein